MSRPAGLRTRTLEGRWWRIEAEPPERWTWEGFAQPRNRFDPASGRFRVRYAARTPVAAARERFPHRRMHEADGDLWVVPLDGPLPVLPLTHQDVLDALELDDRISTGRVGADGDPLLEVCWHLSDAVHDWFAARPPALLYRSRRLPSSRNLAFTEMCGLWAGTARPLREATALLTVLVARHGFAVPTGWLA